MVELVTTLDEEGQDPKPAVDSIDEEQVRIVQVGKENREWPMKTVRNRLRKFMQTMRN